MVWVKICGITNIEDADRIASLNIDAIGFIFSSVSLRKVDYLEAKKIIDFLKNKYETSFNKSHADFADKEKIPLFVGVFVNEDIDIVVKKVISLDLDFVQFSGDEDKNYLSKFKKKLEKEIMSLSSKSNSFSKENNLVNEIKKVKSIKTIRVNDNIKTVNEEVFQKISEIGTLADYFLLDKCRDNMYGGTGETFNWSAVKDLGRYFPIILSGGLCPENVAEAIKTVKPFGVDASSRLEIIPGKKDIEKVSIFIKNAKSR
ncbi:MAG: phosphoribosylanthranilate isomerase [Actinobacteria bacterium]|nr:phosphoribosylanthranilate isomerase [Actinomycetota bacterium]